DNIIYVWEAIEAGDTNLVQGNDSLTVGSAGIYRVVVINQLTFCSDSDTITVDDIRTTVPIDTMPVTPLGCGDESTTVGVSIADTTGLTIQWFGPADPPLIAEGVLEIQATSAGTYTIVVIDNETSCVSQATIIVDGGDGDLGEIVFEDPGVFDCTTASLTIDASASLTDVDGATITWTSLNGNNITPPSGSLIVSVDGAGDYVVSIEAPGGCSAMDTITIVPDADTPFADAGSDITVDCGETPTLDGTGSSTPGGNITLNWEALDGAAILMNPNSQTPIVSGPGTYVVTVSNIDNNCADTDTVMVIANTIPADAGDDFTVCGDSSSATLMGNIPPGTEGFWTIIDGNGGTIETDANVANISNIVDNVTLGWTLTVPGIQGCENYDTDTVSVAPEMPPIAVDDNLLIEGNDGVGNINVLTNDQRTGPVDVTLLGEAPFGELTFLNGELTFSAGIGVSGQFELDYEICSTTCLDCDQGTITVRVDAAGQQPPIYNAITPNGDGLNETLIFELLNFSPEEFPNNELIIFNRWGDILFEAAPYLNDWDGRTSSGQELPEGTYYYILRLSLGEGDIIRGDITVIR
ncbi:MAG: gliding motility-associated C-terminal domain-containing protein, partial [Bacteroidota bacterium]